MRKALAVAAMVMIMTVAATAQTKTAVSLDSLKKGQNVGDWRAEAVYLNGEEKPIGARFVHRASGFTLDLMQIESVPQGYTYVNSIPVGDQGEPHTQEHLLLGKGTTGREFAGLDTMWLAGSTAFTQQWRTSYHFSTAAGPDVFFDLFAAQMNALLHPNYSDEEIRREVRHFGITDNGDGTLRLEEKGSVYNEMTSSSANRASRLFRVARQLVYGAQHPLSYNSGGEPSGIRNMQPEDIRKFHKENYYLGNIGTIASFPKSVPVGDILTRLDAILDKAEKPAATPRKPSTATALPKPAAAPAGTIQITEFPHRNDQQPGQVALVWPANRNLGPEEYMLLTRFLQAVAGDATTNLYKTFIDSKTRTMDVGATSIFSSLSNDLGQPVFITLNDVTVPNLTNDKLAAIRDKVLAELTRVAALPDGSAELKEFNERVLTRVIESERDLAKFISTPPGWGARGTGSGWEQQIRYLETTPDFRKSMTLEPQLAFVRKAIAGDKNIWREYLPKWGITNTTPYVAAAKPSSALLQREEQERVARANAEAARLAKAYNLTDTQEALRRYRTEYDAESVRIEKEASAVKRPSFVKSPPLTIDPGLQYEARTLENGVPLVVSTFDNMTSATAGLALRVDGLPREQLRYLSLLPTLLTRVGVLENGRPVSFEEMSERLRKEVLNLNATFSANPRTERLEMVVRGSGIGQTESARAIEWMQLVLQSPDWRVENLPRIRDVVDQSLSSLRNVMQGSEESWVNNPADAYRLQHNPHFLAANSFLTSAHNALRLRWLLKEAPAADREALAAWFNDFAVQAKTLSRADLKTRFAAAPPATLSPAAQTIVKDALRDLDLTLIDIPDDSLANDVPYLIAAMRDDLMTPPAATLAALNDMRQQLLRTGGARMFFVTSTSLQKALMPKLTALATSTLQRGDVARAKSAVRLVDQRLAGRNAAAAKPVHVGLLAPNMKGGVIITSVPGVHYADYNDKEKQLDYLASRLHAGAGAHGVFLRTLATGLAYSNGLRGSVGAGRIGYYAERTPEIPQTVKFVVETLKNAERDETLGDYAVAQVFSAGEQRAANTYESRAEGIANDLADGVTPDMVRKFRESILELRKDPQLGAKLFDRKDRVYGKILPGYNMKASEVEDGYFFAIGSEKQLEAWSRYIKNAEGETSKVFTLYPRDFWLP
ncbi:MAG TPA: hypothetical protein VF698_16490 [Thermoanaerobaculia bacterium]